MIGYGIVSDIRVTYGDGSSVCIFCCGKLYVAPLIAVTVPRLELTAATTAAKLCDFIFLELEYEFNRVYNWTDATIGLLYIFNKSTRFQTFVANRLNIIQSLTSVEQWRYVDSHNNPADLGSRGLMPNKIDIAALWFLGPEFLRQDKALWPKPK